MSKLSSAVSFGFLTGRYRLRSKENFPPPFLSACLLVLLILASSAVGQSNSQGQIASRGGQTEESVPQTANKSDVQGTGNVFPEFLGTYGPDGKFTKTPRRPPNYNGVALTRGRSVRPAEVPPWVNLHPLETVVENYVPPTHATTPSRPPSQLGGLRDNFLTAIYGHEAVLCAPTHVVTDSKGRVVVNDPGQHGIHVLADKDSFRIVAGDHRRLEDPDGIAIDRDDNIYVADSKLGLVQVFDSEGRFVRTIGDYKGESMFDHPTGIAIDRNAGRLYVIDSGIDQLVVLDLKGNVLTRIGGHRHRESKVKFEAPSEIAAANNVVAVLDAANTRIQVLDPQGNLLAQFRIRNLTGPPDDIEMGLAMDTDGHIYISNLGPGVNIYEQDGRVAGSIGGSSDEFKMPAGVWIDDGGRIYVSDTNNSRIQVFQAAPRAAAPQKSQAGQ